MTRINNRGGCALPKVTPPHFLYMASSPPRSGGGVKERSPYSPRIPDSPPPRRAEEGRKGHLQRIGTLPSLPPPTAHTQGEGRGLQRRSPALFLSLWAGTKRARHPQQLPPPEPRDRHRNQFWREGGRAQSFPNALPENTGRGRKQETPKEARGEIVALSPFSRPEVKFSYSAK